MGRGTRLSGSERRTAILDAAIPLFARKGFHGVRTRELAEAAGVSEALLYKHFPGKDALYAEIQRHVHDDAHDAPAVQELLALPAGAEKLVAGLQLLVSHVVEHLDPEDLTLPRLMLVSLLDDGAFARGSLARFAREWFPLLEESLAAARRRGDAERVELPAPLGLWLVHHLAFALKALALPGEMVDYGADRRRLAEAALRFALRGLGLRSEVIARHTGGRRLARWRL